MKGQGQNASVEPKLDQTVIHSTKIIKAREIGPIIVLQDNSVGWPADLNLGSGLGTGLIVSWVSLGYSNGSKKSKSSCIPGSLPCPFPLKRKHQWFGPSVSDRWFPESSGDSPNWESHFPSHPGWWTVGCPGSLMINQACNPNTWEVPWEDLELKVQGLWTWDTSVSCFSLHEHLP